MLFRSYESVDVIPVSDPNAATMAQKVVQYQAALQLAGTAPQLYDLPLLHRQMLDVLGIKNYQKLVPIEDDLRPTNPVTENQNILAGKPVKAFIEQDHKSHIAVHMAASQDPQIMQLISQDPALAQRTQAQLSAHVSEHLGMEYRKQMEQMMGTTLPIEPEEGEEGEQPRLSPEIEAQIAQMAAQAAQQLLAKHQQEAQAAKAQQQSQDPLIQMQQQELQIKMQDLQRKAQKDMTDAQLKAQQIEVEKLRIQAQQENAGAQLAIKAAMENKRLSTEQEVNGFKAGLEAIKHKNTLSHQKEMANRQQNQPKKETK